MTYRYGEDSAPTVLEDIDCPSGSYLVLLQCYYSYQYTSYCNKDIHDAFVDCCKYYDRSLCILNMLFRYNQDLG